MIDIRVNRDKMTVIATGHADAPRTDDGRDLVCCAVSTLVQTVLYSCQGLPGVIVTHDIKPGDAYVSISSPDSQMDAVRHRLDMLSDGIRHLEEKFPMCVKLK